jgi:hypothetical protein
LCFSEDLLANCEFSPEPDGEIAFEWYSKNKSTFSISLGKSDKLSFAGLLTDGKKVHGVISCDKEDIEFIKPYIETIISEKID